jgi:hypothetical protein
MKISALTVVLLLVIIIGACAGNTSATPEIPKMTPTPAEAQKEIRPGIYMSNDPADFPFPVSGYEVYIIGEAHGNRETKQLFQTYLKALYKEAGLRDVILEEHHAYESDANAFVQRRMEDLPVELCRRTDILGIIRELNAGLPENDRVIVHLVDLDSPLSVIYKHLAELHAQLGSTSETIVLPAFSDFENWSPRQVTDLLAALGNAAAN